MPLAIPPELKKISPYIRRAEELDKDRGSPESRLVAYYCRQYAVHLGIPLAGSSAGAKTCLGHLLENLEAEKPAMDNFTRDEAAFLCRKFANKVFDKADEEDRLGLASKSTAKTFYAASTFLQILEQFSSAEDQSEERLEDKKRIIYAKWKSTDILKCIKEGKTPTSGGYGEEDIEIVSDEHAEEGKEESAEEKKQDAPVVETVHEDEDDYSPPAVYHPPPNATSPLQPVDDDEKITKSEEEEVGIGNEEGTEIELGPPPVYPGLNTGSRPDRPKVNFELPPPVAAAQLPSSTPKKSGGIFGFGKKKTINASKDQMADAMELTRFALAALEDRDAELAAERLQQALNALGR